MVRSASWVLPAANFSGIRFVGLNVGGEMVVDPHDRAPKSFSAE
jgi:hypothetical protein